MFKPFPSDKALTHQAHLKGAALIQNNALSSDRQLIAEMRTEVVCLFRAIVRVLGQVRQVSVLVVQTDHEIFLEQFQTKQSSTNSSKLIPLFSGVNTVQYEASAV